MTIRVLSSEDLGQGIQEQINALFRQLNPEMVPLDTKILLGTENPATFLCCWEGQRLIGMACMATYRVVSGYKGWIEDVVVDQRMRGKGIGRRLINRLIVSGREQGLTEIFLFTGQQRKPAIALYESLGFQKKESFLYRYNLQN